MKVTKEQYEYFRDTTSEVREVLWKLDNRKRIGDVPMTSRFVHCVDNMMAELMQVYFEEVKGEEERAEDARIAGLFREGK